MLRLLGITWVESGPSIYLCSVASDSLSSDSSCTAAGSQEICADVGRYWLVLRLPIVLERAVCECVHNLMH